MNALLADLSFREGLWQDALHLFWQRRAIAEVEYLLQVDGSLVSKS